MTRFINKALCIFALGCLFTACSDKSNEQPTPQQENEVTQEIALPETAPQATQITDEIQTPEVAEILPEPEQEKPVVVPVPQKMTAQPKAQNNQLTDEEIIARFQQWDNNLNTLSTSFNQLSAYDGVEISRSQGNLYYEKKTPMLRLDTLTLDGTISQTALTDKKTILILDDQNQPITTLSWQEWQQGQPNQALFDFGNYTALLARHNAAVTQRTPVNTVLLLTPKEGEKYELYLTLDNRDYFPTEIKIVADLMTTTAALNDTRTNTDLDTAALFGGFNL